MLCRATDTEITKRACYLRTTTIIAMNAIAKADKRQTNNTIVPFVHLLNGYAATSLFVVVSFRSIWIVCYTVQRRPFVATDILLSTRILDGSLQNAHSICIDRSEDICFENCHSNEIKWKKLGQKWIFLFSNVMQSTKYLVVKSSFCVWLL